MTMRLTKNDMARVIVQALHGSVHLPAADNWEVLRIAKRGTVAGLSKRHKLACKVLDGIKKCTLPAGEVPPGLGWRIETGNHELNVWVRS